MKVLAIVLLAVTSAGVAVLAGIAIVEREETMAAVTHLEAKQASVLAAVDYLVSEASLEAVNNERKKVSSALCRESQILGTENWTTKEQMARWKLFSTSVLREFRDMPVHGEGCREHLAQAVEHVGTRFAASPD